MFTTTCCTLAFASSATLRRVTTTTFLHSGLCTSRCKMCPPTLPVAPSNIAAYSTLGSPLPPGTRSRSSAEYSSMSGAMPQCVSRELELVFVSELCHVPPETPGRHRDLRGHADAHRCCGKSLRGTALVSVDARQHARPASLSKRAPSTSRNREFQFSVEATAGRTGQTLRPQAAWPF